MNRFSFLIIAALLLAAGLQTTRAQQGAQLEKQLASAQHKATVDGDLKSAIEAYKAIVAGAGANRALAAQVLVRVAAAYEKLGDPQARKIYEQIVREYADQTEQVALARTRLGRGERSDGPHAIALRKVWTDDTPEVGGARWDTEYGISADGRYMTYVGDFNTKLVLRDLTTGADRPLTNEIRGTYASAISKDSAQVAYNWCTWDTTCEVRVASLQGTGVPVSRRLFGGDDVQYIAPKDWSPDGKWLAVSLRRKDRTAQIGLIGVSDGTLRVLKSVDWRGPTRMFFSPDGRDVAFDLPVNDDSWERDVFVLAVDGSREVPAVVHPSNDIVMGWAPDGTHLLFASDRSSSMGLWAQAFAERKPQGAPELVKPDIGNVSPLGITRSGALHMALRANDSDIEVASIDLTTGRQNAPPVRPIQRFTGSNREPTWSPNGKSLAYVSVRGEEFVVAIRSTETGDTRELRLRPRMGGGFAGLTWTPDGGSLAVYGQDFKGRAGVHRIDARSGDVVPIMFQSRTENLSYEGFFWSPDGSRMYYHGQFGSIYERDLTSGNERILVPAPPPIVGTTYQEPDGKMGSISVSPDGRWIASLRSEASGKSAVVVLIPVSGGEPRDLLRVNRPEWVNNNTSMPWTPDGRGILVSKITESTSELLLVPIDGAAPQKLEFDANGWRGSVGGRIKLHPDGHQLVFVSGNKLSMEVWVLENFLPALSEPVIRRPPIAR